MRSDPARLSSVGCVAVLVSFAALVVMAGASQRFPFVNHDVAHFLYSGRKLLGGERLYVDWYTLNPPPLFFVAMATDVFGSLARLGEVAAYHLFVFLVAGLGLLVTYRVLAGREHSWVVGLTLLAYATVVIRPCASVSEFGQREHLFTLLFLPYFLWRIFDGPRTAATLTLSVLLGFLSLMKPYFLVYVLVTEAFAGTFRTVSLRSLGLRLWALAAGVLLVFVLLWTHSQDSFLAFFHVTLPYHLGGGYTGYGRRLSDFLTSTDHVSLLLGGLLLVAGIWLNRGGALPRPLLRGMVALPVLAYLAVLHQGKLWPYHTIPVLGMLLVFGSFLLGRALAGAPVRRPALAVVAALALVLLMASGGSFLARLVLRPPRTIAQDLAPLVEPGDRVMFFSPSMLFIFAPLHLDLDIVGPWSIHYSVPGLMAIEGDREREDALARYASEVWHSIAEERPDLLLFGPWRQGLRGRTLHDLVVGEHGIGPGEGYRRISSAELARCCDLVGWTVYRRIDSP